MANQTIAQKALVARYHFLYFNLVSFFIENVRYQLKCKILS